MSQDIQSFLTFVSCGNTFGIHVKKVIEIQEYKEPKTVPESLEYVIGVMDHRSEVIPIIDSAIKFNLGKTNITTQTCVVVIEIDKLDLSGSFHIGILVDHVSDVFESDPDLLKRIETDFKPGYIDATYKIGNELVMILDTNKVFTDKDIIQIGAIISEL